MAPPLLHRKKKIAKNIFQDINRRRSVLKYRLGVLKEKGERVEGGKERKRVLEKVEVGR